MYEFVCRTADERRVWIQTLRDAIISCSQEGWIMDSYILGAISLGLHGWTVVV